jgi:hypothetical protein
MNDRENKELGMSDCAYCGVSKNIESSRKLLIPNWLGEHWFDRDTG